jgi:hypothetical protein
LGVAGVERVDEHLDRVLVVDESEVTDVIAWAEALHGLVRDVRSCGKKRALRRWCH